MSPSHVSVFMSLLTTSLSVKRGPYKKRDGEYPVPTSSSVSDVAPPGMLNELQRISVGKSRTSRVSSVSEPPSQPSTLASISQLDQSTPATVPMYAQNAQPSEGSFPYSAAVMVPAHPHPQSLTSMHSNPSTLHANAPHQPSRDEDQYYQPRYDNLAHGSSRSGQFRMDSCVAQQDYQTGHLSEMIEQRNMRTLQYSSSENSPPRERQYSVSGLYNDNHHRHDMIQTSTVHHDAPYQPQSDSTHESPARTVDAHYPYANQHHQRAYSNDAHMTDTHAHSHTHSQQQEIQQPHHPQQQQQNQYYSAYNTYQSQPSSYASHAYDYSQNHPSHVLAPDQHVSEQTGSAYLNRMPQDQVSYGAGSSINAYPTHQSHPSQHTMSNGAQYPMRTAGRAVHRDLDLVAHQHAGNVQISSN